MKNQPLNQPNPEQLKGTAGRQVYSRPSFDERTQELQKLPDLQTNKQTNSNKLLKQTRQNKLLEYIVHPHTKYFSFGSAVLEKTTPSPYLPVFPLQVPRRLLMETSGCHENAYFRSSRNGPSCIHPEKIYKVNHSRSSCSCSNSSSSSSTGGGGSSSR